MATIEEVALGITAVLLASKTPEPLGIDLRGQTNLETVRLVRRVIDECADANCPLTEVHITPSLLGFFGAASHLPCPEYREVSLVIDQGISERVEFFRRQPEH